MCVFSPGLSSPPASLYDRYSSPTANPTRRRLFADSEGVPEGGPAVRVPPQPVVSTVPVQSPEAVSVTPVPGQTLVTVATATVTANNGQTVTIPVQGERKVAAQPFSSALFCQGTGTQPGRAALVWKPDFNFIILGS